MSMTIDNRRFLRRHFPTFSAYPERVNKTVDGEAVALRFDGVVFYSPNSNPSEIWVAWLAKDGSLKSTPAPRRVCSLEEYNEEMTIRAEAINALEVS